MPRFQDSKMWFFTRVLQKDATYTAWAAYEGCWIVPLTAWFERWLQPSIFYWFLSMFLLRLITDGNLTSLRLSPFRNQTFSMGHGLHLLISKSQVFEWSVKMLFVSWTLYGNFMRTLMRVEDFQKKLKKQSRNSSQTMLKKCPMECMWVSIGRGPIHSYIPSIRQCPRYLECLRRWGFIPCSTGRTHYIC